MKNNRLVFIWLSIFIIIPHFCNSQSARPSDWPDIIKRPWYQGTVSGKPAFVYLDSRDQTNGYFFIADKALPDIYQLKIRRKNQAPHALHFRMNGKKIRVKFEGAANPDTISGMIKTGRRNSRKLVIPTMLSIFMVKEISCPNVPLSPCPPVPLLPRYLSPIFDRVGLFENLSYGAASGYYTSMPIDAEGDYDYQQIILDALNKMFVHPTRDALLNILNKDLASLAVTDLQGLRLDLYQPVGDTLQKRPVLVLLHGGAFIMGDKATPTMQELANNFAAKGYVVAAINYRMGFNPASKQSLERSAYRAVQDARAAMRYLSYNAATYRIDPDEIFLGGSSAGAITSLNAAFMKEDERPESSEGNIWQLQKDLGGLDESTNTYQNTYKIRAVANLWGAVNDTNLIDREERIPVLSFHGDADKIVPCECNYPFTDLDTAWTSNIVCKLYGSRYINRRLTNLGIPNEMVIFPGAGHEPQFEADNYTRIMDTIIDRTTNFYYRAMFGFPKITGPELVKAYAPLPVYNVPYDDNLSYYWQVDGGKVLSQTRQNQARIVWLTEGTGNIALTMVHKNQANMKLDFPVKIPEGNNNYFTVKKSQ
jgi:pimeloyl-ACP methyl ester carboxylesterase